MYSLKATNSYVLSRDKVVGGEQVLKRRLRVALEKLTINPLHPSLKSHKVSTDYGMRWSSWVTGDVRVIWDYDREERLVLVLIAVGKHSGTHKVYK